MASWNDVKKYVKANFVLEHETANNLGMNFRFEDGRTQKIGLVYAGEVDAFGGEWAKFVSPVAEFTPARLAKAAELAGDFHCGGIAVSVASSGTWITLQDGFRINDVDVNEIFEPLHTIAATADLLEKALTNRDIF